MWVCVFGMVVGEAVLQCKALFVVVLFIALTKLI